MASDCVKRPSLFRVARRMYLGVPAYWGLKVAECFHNITSELYVTVSGLRYVELVYRAPVSAKVSETYEVLIN